jgi:hypothetical protein
VEGTGGGNGTGDPPATPPAAATTPDDDDDDLDEADTAKLKEALRKERQARREASRKLNEQLTWRQQQEKAATDAATKEAAELGEWKTVAETHEAHVKELEGQLAKKDRDLLATRIAAKHQLPETLAARLMGDDADALEADAAALAKLIEKPAVVPPSSGSPANGARPNNGAPIKAEDLKKMDWQQIAKLKDEGKLNHLLEGQSR